MTIMVGRKLGYRQAGMLFAAVAENFHLIHEHEAERSNWEWWGILKPQNLSPVTHLLHHGHTS